MTLFSRCDASQISPPSPRLVGSRRAKTGSGGVRRAVSGFAEDIGILVRYAVGLDYYDRAGMMR